jgi:DcmR-like sensory protein
MKAVQPWRELLTDPAQDDHVVQLYQDLEFYGEAISIFACAGLRKGESVIIVATNPHWKVIGPRIEANGFDLQGLKEQGQLTLLNADETLPRFMLEGMPDGDVFKEIAGDVILRARAGGRYPKVRWWGEMVNVLWEQGNTPASLRLEELFHELANIHSIAIFCSFLMDTFNKDIYGGPLQGVCRTHHHLIPVEDYGRLEAAVEQAIEELIGPQVGMLEVLSQANHASLPVMPRAQAILLWLREHIPTIADKVLLRARRYYDQPMTPVIDGGR